jgi:uncharacterized protein
MASPPEVPPPARRVRARTLVLVTLGALLLTAVFNAGELVKLAQQMSFGWQRTAALRLADADQDVSRALWLDKPRGAVDRLLGRGAPQGTFPPPVPPTTSSLGTTTTVPTTLPTSTVPGSTTTTTLPRPTASHPLTVYVAGDSVGIDLAEGFEQLVGASNAIDVDDDARVSTGLTRPDYFDWPARLQQVLAARPPPQVVIVMFGANDVQPIMTPSGPASVGTTAWLAEYRRRVAATMDILSASGADVYWVGQPIMQDPVYCAHIRQLDDIYASEARQHARITFVDTWATLANAAGQYSAYLPDQSGQMVQVRYSDGIHLTLAGAERVATAVVAAMRHHWNLPI